MHISHASNLQIKPQIKFQCTFLLIEKYQKIKAAKKMAIIRFIPLQKKNSPGKINRAQTAFSVNRFIHLII